MLRVFTHHPTPKTHHLLSGGVKNFWLLCENSCDNLMAEKDLLPLHPKGLEKRFFFGFLVKIFRKVRFFSSSQRDGTKRTLFFLHRNATELKEHYFFFIASRRNQKSTIFSSSRHDEIRRALSTLAGVQNDKTRESIFRFLHR